MGLIYVLRKNLAIVALCAMLAALSAAPASAQETSSVTADQYDESGSQFSSGGGTADPGVGSLPFTGLDLGLMGAAAAALMGVGVLMRRRTASEEGN
jgi:hypothetical protein